MERTQIGVQAMMLKNKFDTLGAYETLKKVHEIGFHFIELSQIEMSPENVSEIKRACQDFDITIAAMSAALEGNPGMNNENLTDHYDKIVQDCKTLNCGFLRIGMLPFPCMASLEKVLAFCEKMEAMAQRLKKDGIDLYYHNHHIEFRKYDGEYLLDIIRTHAPSVGFELDVHWIQRGGEDPIRIINQYAGKVSLLHLKDYRIGAIPEEAFGALAKGDVMGFMSSFTNVVQFAEVGEGNLNMKEIIETGKRAGAKFFLIEQDDQYGKDPFECLQISHDNLISLGYEM